MSSGPSLHNRNEIRKRARSSSSSSSLVPRKYRFKRAFLVAKKGGSNTPVPMWKTRTASSPSTAPHHLAKFPSPLPPPSGFTSEDNDVSVSARKLAAALWEINDVSSSKIDRDLKTEQVRRRKGARSREKVTSLSRSDFLRSHVSDPLDSPKSEMNGIQGEKLKKRVSNKLRLGDHDSGGFDFLSSPGFMEAANQQRNKTCGKCTAGVKNRLKEARSGLSTSKKLLKVLNQMCLQEQHSSSIPVILALGSELDRACNQIDHFIQEQSSNQNDTEFLMKRFAEEKAAWKRREREKVRDAITHIAEELEVEKKLRRQTERLNKKIAKEMANAKASHLKASKELEREKRAKEILEQICDELAKGIEEDRAQVEELKRESAKVREEVEKEREMFQLADDLREKRVQMKLSEAKYQFEEKNAVLEKLRNELEAFWSTKVDEGKGDISPEFKQIKELESDLNKTCWGYQAAWKEDDLNVGNGVEHEGDDSADSDLHSIELNMDNDNRSYKWSYTYENDAQDDSGRVSMDKESIGRKSFSEKIQWTSICFNKGNGGSTKRDFGIEIKEISDELDQEISSGLPSRAHPRDDKDKIESYRSIMGFRDSTSCANPDQRCGQPLFLQDTVGESEDNSVVVERGDLIQEAAGRKFGR
ncbi:uncharacterized protein At5g41620 isoform X2 [Prosopis cineraria]|uniref:uncharacterized protein At5g41620 isoform X2 n=1 Tax=Prosopis cineraria TaxID=364024 RepID=UPI00240F0966|nr:uncharacterized protein At5g41620 isoform X2 [Prosopis cineraria]